MSKSIPILLYLTKYSASRGDKKTRFTCFNQKCYINYFVKIPHATIHGRKIQMLIFEMLLFIYKEHVLAFYAEYFLFSCVGVGRGGGVSLLVLAIAALAYLTTAQNGNQWSHIASSACCYYHVFAVRLSKKF